jgi:AraC-like DNA-binding protein
VTVVAWAPGVDGIAEVLHARFTDHVYPMHTHDTWTLLVIDAGAVRYDLDRHEHGAFRELVTLLPPHVPHNGGAATAAGFRKRVLYLDGTHLPAALIGPAVGRPAFTDPALRLRIDRLHASLAAPGDALDAESRLAFVAERLRAHLGRAGGRVPPHDASLAHRLRDLLDARGVAGVSLAEAAALLFARPTHLVRAFGREFGLSPHRYVVGRRVDAARRLLLAGVPPGTVAAAAGFYDQAHLNRHFTRMLGISPGRYAVSGLTGASRLL